MASDLRDVIADGNEEVDAIVAELRPAYQDRLIELRDQPKQREILILRQMLAERMERTASLYDDEEAAAVNARAIADIAVLSFDDALSVPITARDGIWASAVQVMLAWIRHQAFAEIIAPRVADAAVTTGDRIAREERDTDARTIVRLARESEPDPKSGRRKPMVDRARREAARARRADTNV